MMVNVLTNYRIVQDVISHKTVTFIITAIQTLNIKLSLLGNIKLLSESFLIFKRIVPPSSSMVFQSVNGFIIVEDEHNEIF